MGNFDEPIRKFFGNNLIRELEHPVDFLSQALVEPDTAGQHSIRKSAGQRTNDLRPQSRACRHRERPVHQRRFVAADQVVEKR